MFYKIVKDGYIIQTGSPNMVQGGIPISEADYNRLNTIFKTCPADTLEAVYRLSNETEEYIAIPRTHEETVDWYVQAVSSGTMTLEEVPEDYRAEVEGKLPTPTEPTYTLDEAATILAQEVSA